MRVGRLSFGVGCVVDLDDPDMIYAAKVSICEDVDDAVKYNEVFRQIEMEYDPTGDHQQVLHESDIPEWLYEIYCDE